MSSDRINGPDKLIFVLFDVFPLLFFFSKDTLPSIATCGRCISTCEAPNLSGHLDAVEIADLLSLHSCWAGRPSLLRMDDSSCEASATSSSLGFIT